MDDVLLLQENLEMLRKLFGWSAEQLGNRLDVTKQTILNLEHGVQKMSRIQYIAIRAVLETEANMRSEEEKQNLLTVMRIVLNEDSSISDEQRINVLNTAKVISSATTSAKDKDIARKTLSSALLGIGIAVGAIAAPLSGVVVAGSLAGWLSTLVKKTSKEESLKKGKK